MPKVKLSPQEQLAKKEEVCNKFIAEVKEHLLQDLTLMIERIYWQAFQEGYTYRNVELEAEKQKNKEESTHCHPIDTI